MRETLANLGHDVLTAEDVATDATDEELLDLALAEQRTIVTEDKDFGTLVYVHGRRHPCIVRFTNMSVNEKAVAMRDLLEQHAEAIREGSVIVVSPNRLRIRRREHGAT